MKIISFDQFLDIGTFGLLQTTTETGQILFVSVYCNFFSEANKTIREERKEKKINLLQIETRFMFEIRFSFVTLIKWT